MKIRDTLIHFTPIFSILSVFLLSITTRTASAMTLSRAAGYARNDILQDILDAIANFFKALLNFILAPFNAIKDVFVSWGQGLYSAVGTWAPLVAVVVVALSLFVLYLFYKFRKMIPSGD